MTAFLALLSSVFIGSADFVGGLASRTANGVRVATFVAIMGLPLAFVVSSYGAERVSRADVIWSVLSGIVVAFGIGCFYIGMGRGLISVVAPVAAVTGAVIPVVYGLARGERPGALALVGLVIAFIAVAVVSIAQSEQHPETLVGVDRHVIGLALAAGCSSGSSTSRSRGFRRTPDYGPSRSRAPQHGRPRDPVARSHPRRPRWRGASWRTAPDRRPRGIGDGAAAPCAQRGPVAIASVLASLYPVTTVLLALRAPRALSRLQYVGVACALVSVALVSTG